MVKVIDKATGEYIEIDYKSYEDFAEQYDELTQRIAALDRAKKKMAAELKTMMGDDNKLDLINGWYFKKVTTERKSYPVARVVEVLGEEDAQKFLKVDKTKLDAELKEHVEDGGAWPQMAKALQDSLEVDLVVESLRLVKQETK